MKPRTPILPVMLVALFAGACASEPPRVEIAAGHPADPKAPTSSAPAPDLGRWLRDESLESAPATRPAGEYVCPMHPEIRSATPGRCPRCGMKLE
jgi:Heavy metal binding domain